jgi:hypothetical protein
LEKLKFVAVLVVCLVVAAVGGFYGGQASFVPQTVTTIITETVTLPPVTKTMVEMVTETITETRTETSPPITITETRTETLPPVTVTETLTKTITVTPIPISPTPTPIQQKVVEVGEPLIVERKYLWETRRYEVVVLDFVRGEQANSELREASIFNPKPEEGFEYLMVKIRFSYLEGEETEYISEYDFKAYVEGAGHSHAWVVLPEDKPEFPHVDLLVGAEVEGWIVFKVSSGKEVLIAFQPLDEPLGFIRIPP